jgi:hypothetical protein
MRNLNAIPEGPALENVAWTRELLGEVLAEPPHGGGPARQSSDESVGELSLKLGLLLYALEADEDEVRSYLGMAAAHLAPALALRERPEPDEHRSPWQGEQWIDVVACWGDGPAVEAVVGLRPWQYRSPVRAEHDALALYLDVLRKYLGGSPIDEAALAGVVRACAAGSATKEDRLFLRPAADGLLALSAGDADGWNYALAQILSAHGREAHEGDLRLLPDGCLSFRALLLAKLGLDRGLSLRAASEYMPLSLVEGEGQA